MAEKLTENGVSTTRNKNEFRTETFISKVTGEELIQWDYRDANGVLHSGVAKSLDEAMQKASKHGFKL